MQMEADLVKLRIGDDYYVRRRQLGSYVANYFDMLLGTDSDYSDEDAIDEEWG